MRFIPLCRVTSGGQILKSSLFMSFDMKLIRRDQKTRRNGEALLSHSTFSGQA